VLPSSQLPCGSTHSSACGKVLETDATEYVDWDLNCSETLVNIKIKK
jgi:hypothetical protein